MAERIGLKAILDMSDFDSSKQRYMSSIGQMSSKSSQMSGGITGAFGKVSSAIGSMATVAGGIVAANVFGKITEGISSFVSTGLDAVSNAQMLEASLGSLLTANNLYEQSTSTMTVAVQKSAEELANEAQQLSDLQLKRETMNARLQEQRERVRQMTEEWTQEGLATQTAKARLAEMENELAKTDAEIMGLSKSTAEYTTVTEKSWNQVMSMAEAQGLAEKQSVALLQAIDKIAIVSPFEQDQVQQVAKFAVAAGLGVEETESFTSSFLDMAAAVGIGSAELSFAADQLLQVKKIGQLTTVDLRQLRRMGIDLEKIIGVEMGMSIEEFNAKAKQSPEIFDDLFKAVDTFSKNTFAGTTERMATSIEGLKSTFSDIFQIGSRNILRPLVDAASPAASEMLGNLADFFSGPRSTAIGEALLGAITSGFQSASSFATPIINQVKQIFNAFQSGGKRGGAVSVLGLIGIEADQVNKAFDFLNSVAESVKSVIGRISGAVSRFGARGGAVSIMGMLGLSPGMIGQVLSFVDFIIEKLRTSFSNISGAFQSGGAAGGSSMILQMLGLSPEMAGTIITIVGQIAQSIQSSMGPILAFIMQNWDMIAGAVLGIRAVFLAAGIVTLISAIGAALATLFTPVTILIGLAALIGAAWVGNWFDIQGKVSEAINWITGTLFPLLSSTWANVMATLQPGIDALKVGFSGFLANLQGLVPVWTAFMTNIQAAMPGLMLFVQLIGSALLFALQSVMTSIGFLLPIVGQLFVAAFALATNAVAGFLTFVSGATTMIVGLFTGDMDMARQGASEIFEALRIAVVDSVMAMAESLAEIISDWLSSTIPDWEKGLGDMLTAVALWALETLASFESWISELATVFTIERFVIYGANVIEGLVKGIQDNASKVLSTLRGIVQGAIQSVTKSLGIRSPSKVFADIGQKIVQGLVVGTKEKSGLWEQELGALLLKAQPIFNQAFKIFGFDGKEKELRVSTREGIENFVKFFGKTFKREFGQLKEGASIQDVIEASMLSSLRQNFAGGSIIAPKFHDVIKDISSVLQDDIKKMFSEIQRETAKALVDHSDQFTGLSKLIIDRMSSPIEDSLESMKEELTQFELPLEDIFDEDELKALPTEVADLVDAIHARMAELQAIKEEGGELSSAQKKLLKSFADEDSALRMALLENDQLQAGLDLRHKIVAAEAELLDIEKEKAKLEKQQSDLKFLQQQLELLDSIKALGLDPSEILKGMTLGLQADLPDLMKAMDSVISTIIGTVDDSLKIASPSQVMMEKGREIMAGMIEGIRSAASTLPRIGQPIIEAANAQATPQFTQPARSSQSIVENNQTVSFGDINVRDEGMSAGQLQQFILRTVSQANR